MDSHRDSDAWAKLELLRQKENSFDWKLTLLALALSIVFHIFLYTATPETFFEEVLEIDKYESLELEILPPPVYIKELPQYIEANPYANKDKPKDTVTKESFQDQRAADMIVDVDSDSDKPYVEGETEESQKIVSGHYDDKPSAIEAMEIAEIMNRDLAPPSPTLTENTQENLSEPQQVVSFAEENIEAMQSDEESAPIEGESTSISTNEGGESLLENIFTSEQMEETGDIKIREKDLKDYEQEDTFSKNISDKHITKGDSKEDVSSQEPKKEISEAIAEEKPKALPKPKSRPSIDMKLTSGLLVDNRQRASSVGIVAVDSSFSEFGAYQQRMLEAISRQWNLLAEQFNLSNIINTVVVVDFYLDREGSLTSFRILYSNSSEIGKSLCEQSIKSTAPYGKWTEDMIAVFGQNDQEVKITFHYR